MPPNTPLAEDAFHLAYKTYSPGLLGHCLRSWLWADLFAQLDGIDDYDQELLYVSCLLHDLVLTQKPRPGSCFAVDGGKIVHELLTEWGKPAAFADRAAEAVSLHMNLKVPPRRGVEAHLLHAATHLDVAGNRAADLPAANRREVISRHPRNGFPTEFAGLLQAQATASPRSRAALVWRLGLPIPLHHNPLDRTDRAA